MNDLTEARRSKLPIFVILLPICAALFCVDLHAIIIGSGWTQLPQEKPADISPSPAAGPRPQADVSDQPWTFAVSGDSRNCGDVVMPAIANSVQKNKADFYWHLGDLRALYNFDEDMDAEWRQKVATGNEKYPLSIPDYQANAWNDFIDHQIAPFGQVPFFIGIGNHELVPPKTREEFVGRFTDWLVTPTLQKYRLAEQPNDYKGHTVHPYYHWIRDGIDFIYIDNASVTIDAEQMGWIQKTLETDMSDNGVVAVVVGMHEALPDSVARDHSMSDNPEAEKQGRTIFHWLQKLQKEKKPVYIFASHSHFYMADIFRTDYWRDNGGALPGWIVGSAGAQRYKLPDGFQPSPNAVQDRYGYLLVSVGHNGQQRTIATRFVEVQEKDVPAEVTNRYPAGFVTWCFDYNSLTHKGPPPP